MLADDSDNTGYAGSLAVGVHLPGEWLSSLVRFIASALPGWRDDPARETEMDLLRKNGERFCSYAASLSN